jgi:hypothetical protein
VRKKVPGLMILLDEWVKLAKVNELAVVDSFDDKAQLWNPSQNRRIEDPSGEFAHLSTKT